MRRFLSSKPAFHFFEIQKRRQVKTLYLIRHGEAVSWSPTIGIHSAWVLHRSLFWWISFPLKVWVNHGKSKQNNKIIRWCRHYCWNTPFLNQNAPTLVEKQYFQHTFGWLLFFQPSVGCSNHQSSKPPLTGINPGGTRWRGGCFWVTVAVTTEVHNIEERQAMQSAKTQADCELRRGGIYASSDGLVLIGVGREYIYTYIFLFSQKKVHVYIYIYIYTCIYVFIFMRKMNIYIYLHKNCFLKCFYIYIYVYI